MTTQEHPDRNTPEFEAAVNYSLSHGYLWFIWNGVQVWVTK